MFTKEFQTIGQILIEKDLITKDNLEEALLRQKDNKQLLGKILVDKGFIEEKKLYQILSEQFGTKFINPNSINILTEVIEKISSKLATHYKLIPVDFKDDTIVVATNNPFDIDKFDHLKLLLKHNIEPVLATETDINDAIKRYYGLGAETIEKIRTDESKKEIVNIQAQDTEDLVQSATDASIIKFVNQILLEAYKSRATDIHIEPFEDVLTIRYRIDGLLYDTKVPSNINNFQHAIISRIKIMANLDIGERRRPQDGRIKVKIEDEKIDLRVSILPTPFGESIVIRILSTQILFSLENLGLLKSDLDIFEKIVQKPHGIVFVTGPTGSGKTTTLYSLLNKINDRKKKILTIEDPVEYQLKGVTQIQVFPKIGLSFSQGLRTMLRHDPDIMMVGEVRDYETAEITIRVALTGHLVFSTLHTNDAVGGVARLVDMQIPPFLITSSVLSFVAQRLVRVICPNCKEKVVPEEDLLRQFGLTYDDVSDLDIFEGKGCSECKFTGYRGRTAIYEILLLNSAIRELILKKASTDDIKKKAVELGMRTLRQDGWEKIKRGITTLSEVIRVTQQEEIE